MNSLFTENDYSAYKRAINNNNIKEINKSLANLINNNHSCTYCFNALEYLIKNINNLSTNTINDVLYKLLLHNINTLTYQNDTKSFIQYILDLQNSYQKTLLINSLVVLPIQYNAFELNKIIIYLNQYYANKLDIFAFTIKTVININPSYIMSLLFIQIYHNSSYYGELYFEFILKSCNGMHILSSEEKTKLVNKSSSHIKPFIKNLLDIQEPISKNNIYIATECITCTEKINLCLLECGHGVICSSCLPNIQQSQCPYCNQVVDLTNYTTINLL